MFIITQKGAHLFTDSSSSESEIEIPRGGSDDENKKPSKSRSRLKRAPKGILFMNT